MFNILIVDDDRIVLDGLRKFINWSELGYRVVGVAQSADDALKIIETEYIDVILTDIVMPGKNGLELIREALEFNPAIKAVILSGYGEFNFAKEALRLGAYDYLMKPVGFAELKDIFIRLKTIIENEVSEKQKQSQFKEVMQGQFLNNLANGFFLNNDRLAEKVAEIGFEENDGEFCLIRILIVEANEPDYNNGENLFIKKKIQVLKLAGEFLNKFGRIYLFDSNLKEISALFYPNEKNATEGFLEDFVKQIDSDSGIKVFIGVGNEYKGLLNAPKSFAEAGKALEYRYIKKDNSLLYYKHLTNFFKGKSVITNEVEVKIQEYLTNGNEKAVEEYIFKILSDLHMLDQSNNVLYDACIEILLIVNRFMENYVSNKINIKQSDHNSIRTLLKKDTYADVAVFIKDYLKDSMAIINSNQEKPMGIAIDKVIKYIDEHYNEDITLNKLSEIAYVHPIYLSKLFKEKTGENFIEYLMNVRVEHAKKLLKDISLRIYDVCGLVGYDSPKHFSKMFKDITGCTPKDYRIRYIRE